MSYLQLSQFRETTKITFSVSKSRYIVAKMRAVPKFSDDIFAILRDDKEVTVVAREGASLETIAEEKFFKLITFDVKLPFELTGFLSHVSALLSGENIPVLVFSAFSTDHVLVKEDDLEKAVAVLEKDGMESHSRD